MGKQIEQHNTGATQGKNKNRIIDYFNPKNIQKEIMRYGYQFSLAKFWKTLFLELASIGVLSYLFGLNLPFILAVMAVCILCTPFVILSVYKNLYEQKRFSDISNYIEQLLYSFKRRAKILTSLEDTLELFHEGQMHEAIGKAINHIKNSEEGDYRSALAFIEEEYGCDRICTAHEFLIKVEQAGGRFEESVELLLDDRSRWVQRTYELQAEKKHVKTYIGIGIALSLLICGITLFMLPPDMQVTHTLASRIVTAFTLIADILIFTFAQIKLTSRWTDTPGGSQKETERYYNTVKHFDMAKGKKKARVKAICMLAVAVAGIALKSYPLTGVAVLAAYILSTSPSRKLKYAKKKISREIEKEFPKWLMQLALMLQTDNVMVAMGKTLETAPFVIKADLQELLTRADEDPGSVVPYLQFLEEFDLPDVQSAMKILFSMNEYGAENSGKQIGGLIQRNSIMTDRAERLKNEDEMAGMSMLVLLPMVTGTLKMLTDMAMLLVSITSMAGIGGM